MQTAPPRAEPRATASPGKPKPRLRTDIQMLRAVAVLSVFSDHLFDRPSGGFVGVDVFFVISGYLITGLLLREGDRSGRISIREFYARRARRIMPIAVLVLLVTAVASRVVLTTLRAQQATTDSWWALLFGANIHFSRIGTDYFELNRPPSPVQHYWSLSVEEQFYVFWPVLLLLTFLLARRTTIAARHLALPLAVVAVVVSFAYCAQLNDSNPTSAYFSTAARTWELGLGAVLAMSQPALSRLPEALRAVFAWVGLAGIGISCLVISSATLWPSIATAGPVVATALVLAADDPRWGPSRAGLGANRPVQYAGLLSYSLYLWHWPAIIISDAYFDSHGAGFYLTAGVLPFALSALSFHLIEDPIHHSHLFSKRTAPRTQPAVWARSNQRPLAAGLAAVAVLFAVPGVAAWSLDDQQNGAVISDQGLATPLAEAVRVTAWPALDPSLEELPDAGSPEWITDRCLDIDPEDIARCTYGDKRGPRTAVILGDSVTTSYLPGIRKVLSSGWRIIPLTRQQCPFVDLRTDRQNEIPYNACYDQRDYEVKKVKELKPDLVIVSGQATVFAGRLIGRPRDALANVALWQAGTQRLLEQVAPSTKRLLFLSGPPGGANLQTCVSTRVADPTTCLSSISRAWQALSKAESAATKAAGGTYVNTSSWFCSKGTCPAVLGDTPIYWDGRHLTKKFSESLEARLRPLLLG